MAAGLQCAKVYIDQEAWKNRLGTLLEIVELAADFQDLGHF